MHSIRFLAVLAISVAANTALAQQAPLQKTRE
jgi:hypothetical protein